MLKDLRKGAPGLKIFLESAILELRDSVAVSGDSYCVVGNKIAQQILKGRSDGARSGSTINQSWFGCLLK